MMAKFVRLLALPPLLATAGMALPVQAAPIKHAEWTVPSNISVLRDGGQANGWDRGRYRNRYRHGRYGGGIGVGDVITGILVIGGAVAVANAISNSNDRERVRNRDRYPDRYPDPRDASYPENRYPDRGRDGQAKMARAIDRCVDDVEREERIATVDTATRVLNGWRVEGALRGGGLYRCEIDSFGDIRDVSIDGRELPSWSEDARQPSSYGREDDDYYAQARARQGMANPDPRWSEPDPADSWSSDSDTQDWQRGEADDRYETPGDAVIASTH